ncbi:hypothetical protein GOBAR_AA24277 [Gossypium barbadense]|uniref:Uncharacterized protein n=1 Tax=Gossypium barbadense TaxID=3634 RepID=A0A2P5WZB0_GOSBA|nr:hypothetical protein GOBAR_AA24277 [Gossypium barbadense]
MALPFGPLVGVPVYKAGTEVKPYEIEKKVHRDERSKNKGFLGASGFDDLTVELLAGKRKGKGSGGFESEREREGVWGGTATQHLAAPPGTARRARRSESRMQFAEYASTRPMQTEFQRFLKSCENSSHFDG